MMYHDCTAKERTRENVSNISHRIFHCGKTQSICLACSIYCSQCGDSSIRYRAVSLIGMYCPSNLSIILAPTRFSLTLHPSQPVCQQRTKHSTFALYLVSLLFVHCLTGLGRSLLVFSTFHFLSFRLLGLLHCLVH